MLEDNEWEAELVQKQLRKEFPSCRITLAIDEKSFLQALDELTPDIILSDNSLPQYNASEALRTVRQRSRYIPFILITGTVSDEFAASIIKEGADDYILKDRLERLPSAIAAAIKQRRTEKELSDYKQALDASSIVAMTDKKGLIIYANENFSKISKYSFEELIGKDHRLVNSGYHPASYMKEMWATITKGEIWRGEFRNRSKDGTIYWVDATIIPFLDREGNPYQYLSIRNDITQRKLAEESMLQLKEQMHEQRLQEQKKLTRVMINAQERERNHIGRELHDNVNQILAGTKIYLGMAAKKNPQAKELIDYSLGLINDAIEEIRQLSSRQVTPIKNVNLHDLVDHLLQHLANTAMIRTEFVYNIGESKIDDDLKLNIYRIIQEQAGNIVKHADAKNVKVLIEAKSRKLMIEVRDDGKGFDPTKKRKGIGLSNMINRVESFNGEIKIISSPGNGCAIEMMIPF